MSWDRAIAANRFGLGARPGELDGVQPGADWLLRQLQVKEALPAYMERAGNIEDILEAVVAAGRSRRNGADEKAEFAHLSRRAYQRQADARMRWNTEARHSFRERLVQFWSNHFSVSVDKVQVAALAFSLEQTAVRNAMMGRFEELLLAAARHPAMLLYLDNARSIGPGSRLGRRLGRGLNENMAREIFELHTLGVDGGYSQGDVQALAAALTGWTLGGPRFETARAGQFIYLAAAHEPGTVRVLGKRYGQTGRDQAEAILRDLARHPATARHLAEKLARHFIADQPPTDLVEELTATYLNSGGELVEVYRALILHPASWHRSPAKYRSPQDFISASLRALEDVRGVPHTRLARFAAALGQPVYRSGSPAGWPDDASRWSSPAALMSRIEWTQVLAAGIHGGLDVQQLARDSLGSALGDHTRTWLERAESQQQALALLLLSPEFQRR